MVLPIVIWALLYQLPILKNATTDMLIMGYSKVGNAQLTSPPLRYLCPAPLRGTY